MEDQTREQIAEIAAEPPCRAAGRYQTQCPTCRRPMSIKHLRYAHRCNKTWDIDVRAAEQDKSAKDAFLARQQAPKESEQKWARMQPHCLKSPPLSSAWPKMPLMARNVTLPLRQRLC